MKFTIDIPWLDMEEIEIKDKYRHENCHELFTYAFMDAVYELLCENTIETVGTEYIHDAVYGGEHGHFNVSIDCEVAWPEDEAWWAAMENNSIMAL